MRNRLYRVLWAFLLTGLVMTAARAAQICPAAPLQRLALPHLRATLATHAPAVIVALGSSSTQGAMATHPGDAYPAELQDFLAAALPTEQISVINRGISGQDAQREDARMARDVVALHPQMVIWQVGANAAARKEAPARFQQLVEAGLQRLEAINADIVLMDNQRSRVLLASPVNGKINAVLAHLAQRDHVNLFSRDALMQGWAKAGAQLNMMLAPDGLHMDDAGYACLAQALTQSIVAAAAPQPAAPQPAAPQPAAPQAAIPAPADAGVVKPK